MYNFFSSLFTELRKNTRLRVGLWLIIGLFLGYLSLLLNDYLVELQGVHQNKLNRLYQAQNINRQSQWLERAPKAQALRTKLYRKFWQANTQGLAQATLQKWFDTQINRIKMKKAYLRIQSTFELPNIPHIWKITARLDANFKPKELNKLLLAMAKQPLLIVTERLEIRNKKRNPRFTLIVNAFFSSKENLKTD